MSRSPWSFSQLFLIAVLVLLFAGTQLQAKYIIVDDADTDQITYSSTGWNVGNTCTGCFAQPNRSLISDGTWHDGTVSGPDDALFFTFVFTGTSVEVMYIAIDTVEKTYTYTTGTNVSYSIDGVQVGAARRNPTDRGAFAYNESLFNVTGLSNDKHTLRVDLLKPSVLLLDYIRVEDSGGVRSTNTTSSTSPTLSATSLPAYTTNSGLAQKLGPIIGVVVAILVLGAVLALYFFKRRRRRQSLQRSQSPILGLDYYAPPPPPSLPLTAKSTPNMSSATTAEGSLSSHSYEPSGISQILQNQSGRTGQPLTLSHTPPHSSSGTGSNPSKASLIQSPPMATIPLTSSFYTDAVASRVQVQIPEEPVEEGLMSRHASVKSVPPPYSPGGAWRDEGAPPLPG